MINHLQWVTSISAYHVYIKTPVNYNRTINYFYFPNNVKGNTMPNKTCGKKWFNENEKGFGFIESSGVDYFHIFKNPEDRFIDNQKYLVRLDKKKSQSEIFKNSYLFAQANRSKGPTLFKCLPESLEMSIAALTGNPRVHSESEVNDIAKTSFYKNK